MSEWNPMTTAPRNIGERILVKNQSNHVTIGQYMELDHLSTGDWSFMLDFKGWLGDGRAWFMHINHDFSGIEWHPIPK